MTPRYNMVVALGGNAISDPSARGTIPEQFACTRETTRVLGDLIQSGHHMLITHGNGPQVGNILRRVELSSHEVYPIDLGLCVADSQAGMGYMIAQCLMNELFRRGIRRDACAIVTTVLVDRTDPAFTHPTKPIGVYYNAEQTRLRRGEDGWQMIEVPGRGFRRVVPSPEPKRILELRQIKLLYDSGELVIACGGGGIPVVWTDGWGYEGLEAVIDKDLSAALLACGIGANLLVILTGPDCVYDHFGTPRQRRIPQMTVTEARARLSAGEFPAGSMRPKVQAAVNYLTNSEHPSARALITSHTGLLDALDGQTGTWFVRD